MILPKITRQRLYRGEVVELTFPLTDPEKPPMRSGGVYSIESKGIQRERHRRRKLEEPPPDLGQFKVQDVRQRGEEWVADVKLYEDPVLLLGRRRDYTDVEERAMTQLSDHEAPIVANPRDPLHQRPSTLGPPPEPEAVPPHEIARYRKSREARDRYEKQHQEDRDAQADVTLSRRLRKLRMAAREKGVDLTPEMADIERALSDAERKLNKAA